MRGRGVKELVNKQKVRRLSKDAGQVFKISHVLLIREVS